MKKILPIALLGLSPLINPASALAEENAWSGEGDLAYSKASGNSSSESLLAKLMIAYTQERWTHTGRIEALNASENDRRSAESYTLRGKTEYDISERYYGFGNGRYQDNRFSGYEYQASLSAGVGAHLIATETTVWDIEGGAGYRRSEEQDTNETFNEAILTVGSTFQRRLTETTRLESTLGVESGADNTFVEGVVSLRVAINAQLALRVAYSVKHNTDVPDDSRNTDTLTSVGLTYSF